MASRESKQERSERWARAKTRRNVRASAPLWFQSTIVLGAIWLIWGGLVLRRDGTKAVPVVADLDPEPTADAGFAWGAAGIGAGIGALAALATGAAVVAVRGRHRGGRPALRPRELG